MPRSYLMEGNATNEQPTSHVFLDTETRTRSSNNVPLSELHLLRCFAASHVKIRRGKVVSTVETEGICHGQFWEWLASRVDLTRQTWVWGHNLGFDWTVLRGWEVIDSGSLVLELAVLDRRCFVVVARLNGAKVVFLSSTNWFRCPLSDMATWVDVVKPPLPGPGDSLDDWMNRCWADVDILKKSVLRLLDWHRKMNLGVLRYTLSSQAMQAWRHRLGPKIPKELLTDYELQRTTGGKRSYVFPIPHNNSRAREAERNAYYGPTCCVLSLGRVEERIFHLDYQSFYPGLLSGNPFPARFVGRVAAPPRDAWESLARNYGGAAQVSLKSGDYEYPARLGERSIRAIGTFKTVLPMPEFRYALARDHIVAVDGMYLYDELELFTAYVKEFRNARVDADNCNEPILAQLAKNMANALPGKFGQRERKWILQPHIHPPVRWGVWLEYDSDGKRIEQYRSLGGVAQVYRESDNANHSFPLIAAYLTSYARLEMHHAIQCAGPANVHYCHVDSLDVTERGLDRLNAAGLIRPGVMGKLALKEQYDWCHYYAVGRVETSNGRRCAGLSRDYKINDQGELTQLRFSSAAEHVSSLLSDGSPLPGVLVKTEGYHLNESAGHRWVDRNNRTHPYELGDKK